MVHPGTTPDQTAPDSIYATLIDRIEVARRLSRTAHSGRKAWMTYLRARVAAEIEFGYLIAGAEV